MKRVLSITLCAVLLLALCACGGPTPLEKLTGSWYCASPLEYDDCLENLTVICEFYDSEIAFLDMNGCNFYRELTINADRTYYLGYSESKSTEALRAYLQSCFQSMYDHRSEIPEYEGDANACANVQEFGDWYDEAFFSGRFGGYEGLVNTMVDEVMGCYTLSGETGTLPKITSSEIGFCVTGETVTETAGYTLSNDKLTVNYADGTVVYSK